MPPAILYFIFGAFSILSQLVVLREISFLLSGQELSLGLGLSSWLFWFAWGTAFGGKLRGGKFLVLAASAASAPLTVGGARLCALFLAPGMAPGLFSQIIFGVVLPAPAAFSSGAACGVLLAARPVSFYLWEALGSCAGGVVYTFLLAGKAAAMAVAAVAGFVFLAAGFSAERPDLKKVFLALAALAALAFSLKADGRTLRARYSGVSSLSVLDTAYSRLAWGQNGSAKVFYEDGFVSASWPDAEVYEPLAHFPLLAHGNPRSVFLMGEDGIMALPEIAKYKKVRADLAAADGKKLAIFISAIKPDLSRVSLEREDPRFFLKKTDKKYDVIIQGAGEPVTASANRFFTAEFFSLAKKKLSEGGILAFAMPSSETYLSAEEAYLDACLVKTARSVFKSVALIAGKELIVLASDSELKLSPEKLSQAYRRLGISNTAARPETFSYFLMPERRAWIEARLGQIKNVPVNSDFRPAAYFYLWRVWLSKYVSPKFFLGIFSALIAFLWAVNFAWSKRGILRERPSSALLAAAGFWAMAAEVCLIFLFQSACGALYWQLGILFSAFMLGVAAGAAACKKLNPLWLCAAALVYSAAASGWIWKTEFSSLAQGISAYSGLLALAGFITGGIYASAAGKNPEAGTELYASDLLGSCAGGFIFSAAVIPLIGLRWSFLAAAIPLVLVFAAKLFGRKNNPPL